MVYNRFVEVGRVAYITYGDYADKYVVIVDIVDQARVLVEGPTSGVPRHTLLLKRAQLTDLVLKFPRAIGSVALKKAAAKQELAKKFEASPWGKKLALRAKRTGMSDFDRFKLAAAKKQRRHILEAEIKKLSA